MCLSIRVELHNVSEASALSIAAHCESAHDLAVRLVTSNECAAFDIAEHAEGCACSMLTEDASSEASTWSLRPDVLPKLANVFRTLLSRARGDVVFEARWLGSDDPVEDQRVTSAELLALIEAGDIATKTRYRIAR